jgi:hypothetical protein
LIAVVDAMLVGVASASPAPQSAQDLSGKYREYSCDQLLKEARSVSVRVVALDGEKHSGIASTESTIVLPAIMDSPKQMTGEIAVLKERMLAIEEAAIQSQCEIVFVPSN